MTLLVVYIYIYIYIFLNYYNFLHFRVVIIFDIPQLRHYEMEENVIWLRFTTMTLILWVQQTVQNYNFPCEKVIWSKYMEL